MRSSWMRTVLLLAGALGSFGAPVNCKCDPTPMGCIYVTQCADGAPIQAANIGMDFEGETVHLKTKSDGSFCTVVDPSFPVTVQKTGFRSETACMHAFQDVSVCLNRISTGGSGGSGGLAGAGGASGAGAGAGGLGSVCGDS